MTEHSQKKRKKKWNNIKNKSLDRSWGFQEVEAPRFQDNRHMKVFRLSALSTGRLYPQGNIPGIILEADTTPVP